MDLSAKPDMDMIAISTIYRKMDIWKTEQATSYGLSFSQVPIVIFVCSNPGISQSDVTKLLAYEKSVIAKSVGKLLRTGYIERRHASKDKRIFNLYPTDKAVAVCPILIEHEKKCMSLLTNGMSEEEKGTLSKLLQKMLENTSAFFEG